jgi:hypothetical protein
MDFDSIGWEFESLRGRQKSKKAKAWPASPRCPF